MGGRGAFANANGKERGLFGNGSGGGGESASLLPAKINRLKATGDLDKLTKHFEETHGGAVVEYGLLVDQSGYGVDYRQGQSGSVNFGNKSVKGLHVVHNHPKGGWANFSGEDLEHFAQTGAAGCTAVSRNIKPPKSASNHTKKVYSRRKAGTYKIERTNHFKQNDFVNAIHGIKVHDDNYDLELHKWLIANQKKYGYKYSYKKTKK